jgi:hypothetical protein
MPDSFSVAVKSGTALKTNPPQSVDTLMHTIDPNYGINVCVNIEQKSFIGPATFPAL